MFGGYAYGQRYYGSPSVFIQSNKTQTGVARIQITTTKTQTGVTRITIITPQTQTGKSRIQAITSKTQVGLARIGIISTQTITGKGLIAPYYSTPWTPSAIGTTNWVGVAAKINSTTWAGNPTPGGIILDTVPAHGGGYGGYYFAQVYYGSPGSPILTTRQITGKANILNPNIPNSPWTPQSPVSDPWTPQSNNSTGWSSRH